MIRVFVNERPLDVAEGASVGAAVAAFDAALLQRLQAGQGRVTDARGIAIGLEAPISAGAILRVIPGAHA